jgi:hypothetical protein
MNRNRRLVIVVAGLLASTTLVQPAAASPAPLQSFEVNAWLDDTEYGCVTDPSGWREPNAAHDALVVQGYTTSFRIASHPGFAPFSDQSYFLCRPLSVGADAEPVQAPIVAGEFPSPGARVEMVIQDLTGTLDDATVVLAEKGGSHKISLPISAYGALAIVRQRGPMHLQYDAREAASRTELADGMLDAPPVPVSGTVVHAYKKAAWLLDVKGEPSVPAEVGPAIALAASKNLPLFVEGR